MSDGPRGISGTLSQRLYAVLKEKPLHAETVADAIEIDRRTLSRWLKSEGTSFKRIAGQARLDVAKQLLADTSMNLAEISAALGFSEPAAFSHAFRRWTGTTPSAWRTKLLQFNHPSAGKHSEGAPLPRRPRVQNRTDLRNPQWLPDRTQQRRASRRVQR